MLTKNFKNMMALILESFGGGKGLLPIKAYNGTTYYGRPYFNSTDVFPYSTYFDCRLNNDAGFWFGSGNTAASENDYTLETKITSGLGFSRTSFLDLDNDGNPYVKNNILVTNTSQSDITISEIGWFQYMRSATNLNGTENNQILVLFDRTVLATPITIAAEEYALVEYTLKTVISVGE